MKQQSVPPTSGSVSPPPVYAYAPGQGQSLPPATGGYPCMGQPMIPIGGEYYTGCEKMLQPGQDPGLVQHPIVPGYALPPGSPKYMQPMVQDQQPQAIIYLHPTPLDNPPRDYLIYSIFSTICCCWIIGVFAILKAAECRSAAAAGIRATAELKSRQAKTLAHVALAVGITIQVILVVLLIRTDSKGVYNLLMRIL